MYDMDERQKQTGAARLLLVDDDRLVLGTLAQGLRHMGYAVHTADSAEDVEAQLADGVRPDLALVDVQMPGAGGLWLAQRFAQQAQVPFVMFSAYGDADIVEQATRCGALGYLVKPLVLAQIQPAIEAALRQARELSALRCASAQLQAALDADRAINVATGITMAQYRLTRQNAFEALRRAARTQRRKLSTIAAETVQACEQLFR